MQNALSVIGIIMLIIFMIMIMTILFYAMLLLRETVLDEIEENKERRKKR